MCINTIFRERENGPSLGLVMMALVRRMNLVLETVEKVCLCVSCVWSGFYIYIYIFM